MKDTAFRDSKAVNCILLTADAAWLFSPDQSGLCALSAVKGQKRLRQPSDGTSVLTLLLRMGAGCEEDLIRVFDSFCC